MALLFNLLRFLFLLMVVRLAFRFVAAAIEGYRERGRVEPPASTDLVRDRVCNTYLPRDRAVVAVVDGQPQHFCSLACRDRAAAPLPP